VTGRIILVTKLKGGSGATTTCREIAAAGLGDGKRIGLIDLDGQAGLSRWWNRRTGDGPDERRRDPDLLQLSTDQLPGAAASLRARYDLTIIDSPPSVHETIKAVAAAADLALIPCKPTTDDIDSVGPIIRLLHGVIDYAFVLTMIPPARNSRDAAEALDVLSALAPILGRTVYRSDYSRPPSRGRTGYEEGQAAQSEIADLYGKVVARLTMTASRDAVTAASRKTRRG